MKHESEEQAVSSRPAAGEQSPEVSSDRGESVTVARFGSFVLVNDAEFAPPHHTTLEKVMEQLVADPRVQDVEHPWRFEEDWCRQGYIYPWSEEEDEVGAGLLAGSDRLHSLKFSTALTFQVEVPAKNQREVSGGDWIPTHYHVAWDGWLAVVTWSFPRPSEPAPMSGGHVVREILETATKHAGFGLYVQACNPGCKYDFAHTTVRLEEDVRFDGANVQYKESSLTFAEVVAEVPPAPDEDLVAMLHMSISQSSQPFLSLKNLGQRILELEDDARRSLAILLGIDYQRALVRATGLWGRPKAYWALRGTRQEKRRGISRLWLALSSIERLRRDWTEVYLFFKRTIEEDGRELLFLSDYADEVERVESLDLALLRAGAEEVAGRLDNRTLTSVTALAGVAGAAAGGIVGAIAGNGPG